MQPRTQRFGNFVIEMENAPGSGVYVAPVGFVKRSFKRTTQTSDAVIVDPDAPDSASPVVRNAVSSSWEVQGSGALAVDDFDIWDQAATDGLSRSFKIMFLGAGANGGRTYCGNGIVNDCTLESDKKSEAGRTQITLSIQSDGAYTNTKNQ